jgi:hypothetical protein
MIISLTVLIPPRGALRGGGRLSQLGYGGLNPHNQFMKFLINIRKPSLFPLDISLYENQERDPLSPPEGEATQGELPLTPFHDFEQRAEKTKCRNPQERLFPC